MSFGSIVANDPGFWLLSMRQCRGRDRDFWLSSTMKVAGNETSPPVAGGRAALLRRRRRVRRTSCVVVNDASLLSRQIAEYYVHKRSVPLVNICHLKVRLTKRSLWEAYEKEIENPIAAI